MARDVGVGAVENLELDFALKANLSLVVAEVEHARFDVVAGNGDVIGRKRPNRLTRFMPRQHIPRPRQAAKHKVGQRHRQRVAVVEPFAPLVASTVEACRRLETQRDIFVEIGRRFPPFK